ncbi:hypothetical protein GCM10010124_04140 [Pilimelia terevasa]|uniref:Uncharacterized protein n=1 Tax=Pilimelia terevasa TaxID=53372 RepID=A0A8J3FEM5_9ACTN|nr:hypothetical protein [Pilimelia terevasa]GGK14721.1 hypothetical protein GCM10010124_04140 [Pilimelia terevasa]
MSGAELARVVDLLVNQVAQWTPARWAAASAPGGPSRAEVVHALAQRLADLAAETEGVPRRDLPRLANDLALPDQLRVVASDLLTAGAPDGLTHAAAADVAQVRATL